MLKRLGVINISITELINLLFEYWYLFFGLLVLWIYTKYNDKETAFNLQLKEMLIFIELGVFFLIIYLLQKYFFAEHNYFLMTIPLFILVWSIFINYLLSKDDVYLLECSFQNEEFINLDLKDKVISLSTTLNIFKMDRGFYETKKHIGETLNPLWNTSRNIKFCNLFKDEFIYHSEYPELQNINFYSCVMLWLKLKKDVPKLIRQNVLLTWLSDWKTAHQQSVLSDNFIHRLKGYKEQFDDKPFELVKDSEQLLEYVKNMKRESDNQTSININTNSENNTDGEIDE